ncbi:MAG: 50S ribosomal protein L31 [cyanobacterium endosymbiont of Rhopalodia musculus]|uniref:50S ribosomal protein L31 n=1 Tax=cyanobacterium endosymbiont of Epithemia clementina EcSB TaxID=3034674 RepID=UPI002480D6F8|nr:50S ribosomal protein L31 [cyanobacterium endosymbiont of Epithemia clementina EcSB]WGT67978.1 50S ribosomal protein L31 [cyanobacterium endosymbiont of Epithemia clementina EcSB]
MAKPDIHPTWYPESEVMCNGEVVMKVGSTRPEINVEVWSGNHPFYTGTQKMIDTEGRIDRFQKRYGNFSKGGNKKSEKKSDASKK